MYINQLTGASNLMRGQFLLCKSGSLYRLKHLLVQASTHASTEAYTHRAQAGGQSRVRYYTKATAAITASHPTTRGIANREAICRSADRTPEVKAMEVEVKIRIPDRTAYDKVAALLAAGHKASYAQENYFFDGANRELNSQRVVLRVRFYNHDEKATITIKGKQILKDGIGRASEVEEDAQPAAARTWLSQPSQMLTASPLVASVNEKYSIQQLVCLGGFKNQREVYEWEGYTLELDETQYDWGTLYEIECETDHPEQLRAKLEAFLQGQDIQYSYSSVSKFANFINKTLE